MGDAGDGVDGSGIRAGIIGEIGVSKDFTPAEQRVLLADQVLRAEKIVGQERPIKSDRSFNSLTLAVTSMTNAACVSSTASALRSSSKAWYHAFAAKKFLSRSSFGKQLQ